MKMRIALMIAALALPAPAGAWIAYGFHSGMSRFDVAGRLSDRELEVLAEGARHTLADARIDAVDFDLVYCSTPQKLYLMKLRLADSPAAFARMLDKFEKRYGQPEGSGFSPGYRESGHWEEANIFLIWYLNESETILLTRGIDGASAEFQDTSVCDQNGEL